MEQLKIQGGGTLTLCQEGPRVRMEAERPSDGKGLYKVWLHGDQGGRLLLGTLVPEGNTLRLRRTLSISELERSGCWPQFRAQALLVFPFSVQNGTEWYCEHSPGRLLADPILKEQISSSMLCRREKTGFSLAVPFRTDRPSPLPALLCLARIERWSGQPHLVWSFDQKGQLIIPNKPEHSGQTNFQ